MQAAIFDVGGVLLVPHYDSVAVAFEPLGISFDADAAERAHYFGISALDAAEDEAEARLAYFVGYAEAAGVPKDQREVALARMREAWSRPNIDVWRQPVRGSIDGL